jgi:hypothetical protein
VLAANLHGFAYTGGSYATAYDWWLGLEAQGYARAGGAAPPAGALLFFAPTGGNYAGHVDVYLGDGRIISSDVDSSGAHAPGEVGIVDMNTEPGASSWAGWNAPNYLGWAEPRFFGAGQIAAQRPSKVFRPKTAKKTAKKTVVETEMPLDPDIAGIVGTVTAPGLSD